MPEEREQHAGKAPGGEGRRSAVPGLLGVVFGGLAALLAFLALRTQREERRPRPAGGPAAERSRPAAEPERERTCAGAGDGAPAGPCAEILEFFGDLRPGAALDRWVLLEIGAERGGAIPVRMEDAAGKPFALQVLRRDPEGPRAPAEEGEIAVYLVGVPGGSATPEEQGLGAMTLASALAASGRPPPAWLRTMRQSERGTAGPGGR